VERGSLGIKKKTNNINKDQNKKPTLNTQGG
jgi:hypothetical protein